MRDLDQCEDIEVGAKRPAEAQAVEQVSNSATAVKSRRCARKVLRKIAVMSTLLSALVACGALVYYFLGWKALVQLVLIAVIVYGIVEKKYRWFYVALMTAPRDITALYRYIRTVVQMHHMQKKNMTIADAFRVMLANHPSKVALIFEDKEWTFTQIEEYSNKIANIFKSHGYKKGDIVALFMENRLEYVGTWLGLSKIGVVIPLINTNLRLSSLLHSITIVKSQAVIFGSEMSSAIEEILDKIESTIPLYQLHESGVNNKDVNRELRCEDLNELLADAPLSAPNLTEELNSQDHLVYIYTSGTTGLPKAAVISHTRFMFVTTAIHWLSTFKPSDKFYSPLPLYHTAGGVMTIGQMMIFGSTIVIRKKFSASAYFTEVKKYEATVCQYIGEMCRYVLAVPPRPEDKNHKLRIAYGNGLRPQIWSEFRERFNIEKIAEFYGATEGNANIMNVDDTVGAVGFISRILPIVYPISIIRVDPNTGDPVRDSRGMCIKCKAGEPGVFVGKIISNDPSRAFLGYVDQTASKKKIVYDVFNRGDSAFISGDLMVADEFGYLFFKDRTGDTFRWKGENVSTSEVEAIVSNIIDYKDTVIYGVEIHGQEGRAGMAAILDTDNNLDLHNLSEGLKKALPSYARPQFIRILKKLDMTGTYKMKKVDLQKDGFDPSVISDSLYYLNSGEFSIITKEIYEQINAGKIRL